MATQASPVQFVFLAVSPTGGRRVGVRSAADERALTDLLRREQLLLMRSWRLPEWTSSAGEIPLKDSAALNEQLGSLVDRGVPITEAMEVMASVVGSATRQRLERMREMVSSGASFSEACDRVGGFDPVSVSVYRSAERAGDLGDAAKRLATAARRQLSIGRKAVTLSIYPLVVICISVPIALGVMMFIVPQIGGSLREQGIELPWYSEIVMNTGSALRANVGLVILALLGIVGGAIAGRRVLFGAIMSVLRRVPAVSRLQRSIEAARFFAVMGAMARSGVPLAEALSVSGGSVGHPGLRSQLDTLQRRLVEGGSFRQLVEEVDELPLATRRLLIAAERTGDLDGAFDALSRDMAEDVDVGSDRLLALLEPLLIVLLFIVIGTLLLSIMIPMITATQQLA